LSNAPRHRRTVALCLVAVAIAFTLAGIVTGLQLGSYSGPTSCMVDGKTIPSGTSAYAGTEIMACVNGTLVPVSPPPVKARTTADLGYTGKADRVTPWQHVLQHCRTAGDCRKHLPAWLARKLHVGPHQRLRVEYEDDAKGRFSTFIWLRMPRGQVLTKVS